MVRLPSLINRTIFRTKNLEIVEGEQMKKDPIHENKDRLKIDKLQERDSLKRTEEAKPSPVIVNSSMSPLERVDKKTEICNVDLQEFQQNHHQAGDKNMKSVAANHQESTTQEHESIRLEEKTVSELQDHIRSLKRSFLFEENNLIEKCELEKFELRENNEEEKSRLKRAFENEKTELLKEIERKDKMLEKLVEVLKEQHQKDLESYRVELQQFYHEKSDMFLELSGHFDSIVENTSKIVENNENTFANLDEFENLKVYQERVSILCECLRDSSFQNLHKSSHERDVISRSASYPSESTTETSNKQATKMGLMETKKSRSFDYDERNDDDIQLEMAEVYRHQKTELVKLFNAEKEEERQRLDKEKCRYERAVRTEYDSRMTVERKAWQDTIEDLEREINILKYEREQLDRNYCLGMDEMRTEFEVEKQQIYKRYSETQTMFENQLRNIRDEIPLENDRRE